MQMQIGQKQILILVASAALLMVFVLAKLQLQRPDVLPVTEVQLQGVFEHVDSEYLAAAALPVVQGNFFTVDVDAIHARISALPWIAFVWVDRIWPNILRIRVQEEQAVAAWNDQGLLNAEARLFVQGQAEAASLKLFGPTGEQQRVLTQYRQLNQLLQPFGISLASLRVDARLSWQAELDNGLLLELGRRDIEARMQRFVKVYQAYLQQQKAEMALVDLRYANGFAVRWKAPLEANKK